MTQTNRKPHSLFCLPATSFWQAGLLCLVCFLCLPASATTIAGTVKDPAGNGISGTLELRLSSPGRVNDPALLLMQPTVKCQISNGIIAANCTARGNDTITSHESGDPAGTFYCLRILDLDGRDLMAGKRYTLTGATLDLGTVQPGAGCK